MCAVVTTASNVLFALGICSLRAASYLYDISPYVISTPISSGYICSFSYLS